MKYLRALMSRITGIFTKDRADDDLRAELEAHLEMETAEYIRRGMHPAEARRRARLASGGMTQAAEAVRDRRGLPWVENIVADFTYAIRALNHSRSFTIIVVLTLALGIGANTAIFSVIRGVLLKPLPHRDGDRLVYLRQSADGPTGASIQFSVPEVVALRSGAPSLAEIAEYSPWFGILQGTNDVARITTAIVTGNFFDVMGLSPVLGRLTSSLDDGKAATPVMVLTHEFWVSRFGGDSSIVGKQVRLDGSSVTVIGVMQPAPFFPTRVQAMTNMVVSPHHLSAMMTQDRSHRMTQVLARLAPGASVKQARTEVAAVHERMRNDFKAFYDPGSHYRADVLPFKEALGERARPTLWLLLGAAAFVLIISAANVTNLTLMRGVRREQELVVRAALGAGISRLRRLLLAENLVLTLAGGALGIAIAIGGVGLLTSFAQRYSARANEIALDRTVLGFTFLVSIALAMLLSFVATMPKEGTFGSISAARHAATVAKGTGRGADRRVRRASRRCRIADAYDAATLRRGHRTQNRIDSHDARAAAQSGATHTHGGRGEQGVVRSHVPRAGCAARRHRCRHWLYHAPSYIGHEFHD